MELVISPTGHFWSTLKANLSLASIRAYALVATVAFIFGAIFHTRKAKRQRAAFDARFKRIDSHIECFTGFGMTEDRAAEIAIDGVFDRKSVQLIRLQGIQDWLKQSAFRLQNRGGVRMPVIARSLTTARRSSRATRSSARQSFSARTAAKSADSGGGSSDPDGPRPHAKTNPSNTHLHVSAFLFGGAK